ncbi:MAG: sulfite exporter TauE/SafE family protein [Alphaproteobacteria bacterium]|uniref:Probable membrane transporter protein n=1 Tax=PS1 clade bacterium TaxID=2175152 RepID=A0A368DRJ4_9PROT|nr:hypothetical protein [Rhodobiaceae bacterium]OUT75422.1 MAG: hypothetical protein CBB85_01085 [Rhizobiales bacterium TMED25]RCL73956.1 MAG: sulfite exporter TauE/SafE family protein [PS1 clade bacterium]
MILDPLFYTMAIPSVILIGLSKGGLTGIGALAVPLMAIVASPLQAAAVLMPILLILDIVAVWTYRKTYDKKTLLITIPASIIGIVIGAILVSQINTNLVRIIIGFIAISFTVSYWTSKNETKSQGHSLTRGTIWGGITGFTSFVTLTGAPPYQMYLLPLRLEQRTYAGTFMIFFWMNNLLKILPFMMLGEMNKSTLITSTILFPISLIFAFVGIWIVRKLPTKIFYEIIYILLFLVSIKLIIDGISNMISIS